MNKLDFNQTGKIMRDKVEILDDWLERMKNRENLIIKEILNDHIFITNNCKEVLIEGKVDSDVKWIDKEEVRNKKRYDENYWDKKKEKNRYSYLRSKFLRRILPAEEEGEYERLYKKIYGIEKYYREHESKLDVKEANT